MSLKQLRILVVDDEQAYCDVVKTLLKVKGHLVDGFYDAKSALNKIEEKEGDYDLVIADLLMPEMDGSELLRAIKKNYPEIEVIIMTACSSIERALSCMKDGAYNYVTKGEDPEELLGEIKKIQKSKNLAQDNALLKSKVNAKDHMLATKSPAYQQVLTMAQKAAENDVNILITGQSGTGKEVLATYIHRISNRKDRYFIDFNCHAFSSSILESELFGHEKGAFTGADSRHIGLFEAADQGTLFLDEIGDIPLSTQAKLLKAIEQKKICRMGSNVPIQVDFRLITATNINLQEAMERGDFREDLYYRLSTIVIEIPPLCQRREDLPLLISYFFQKSQEDIKKVVKEIPPEVEQFLLTYDYPGNVRELKNIIERLVVLSEDGTIPAYALPLTVSNKAPNGFPYSKEEGIASPTAQTIAEGNMSADSDSQQTGSSFTTEQSLRDFRKDMEKKYITYLLEQYPGDMEKIAEILSISRRQLFNKLVEYGMKNSKE